MALDRNVQVELSEHGIAYKKVSGKTCVYLQPTGTKRENQPVTGSLLDGWMRKPGS